MTRGSPGRLTLNYPQEGKKLVQHFDQQMKSPFQHPGIAFAREAEEYDPRIVGAHPPVTLLEEGSITSVSFGA